MYKNKKQDSNKKYSKSYSGKQNSQNRQNGNGKRNYQPSDEDPRQDNRGNKKFIGISRGSDNDASWYAATPQLVTDSASMSFSWPTGNPVSMGITDNAQMEAQLNKFSIPGVMAIWLVPMVGISNEPSSPVSTAAINIYSYVRHANSGHPNYDAPDLMLYLLAMDSVYSYYTFLIRAYGLINAYSQHNRYYPQALLEGMCLDFTDILNNIADFRYYINSFAVRIGSMCVPSSMSYFSRHQWVYSNIFTDSTSAKAQSFMYCPYGFHQYNETSGPGKLSFRPFYRNRNNKYKLSDLIGYGNMLINPLLASEDLGVMSGDILKAFTADGVFKVAQLPETFLTLPVYSEEVLSQIQNTTILNVPAAASTCDITQDPETGAIFCNYRNEQIPTDATSVRAIYAAKRMMSMYKDNPTPDDIMVASRLMVPTKAKSGQDAVDVTSCGSEVAVLGEICSFTTGESPWYPNWDTKFYYAMELTNIQMSQWLHTLQKITQFHYHPIVFLAWDTEVPPSKEAAFYFDVNNYNIVSEFELAKMHETALLSQFTVPQMGAFARKY